MTWLGINPFPPGFGARTPQPNMAFDVINGRLDADTLLVRGTVMLETELPSVDNRSAPLILFKSDVGWKRRFSLRLDASQTISLAVVQGGVTYSLSVSGADFVEGARVRVSYTWDAIARTAHLTVQNLDRFSVHHARIERPVPLPLSDLRDIVSIGRNTRVDRGVICLAIADHAAPICLNSGLSRGCPVATTEGYRPVERLALGDMVLTADNGPKPIRWITRTEMPAVGHFTPIRLRAPFFGLARDIVVAQSQGIFITGSDAEYLFGTDTVLVRAENLTSLHSARYETELPTVTYYQILLDSHECLDVGGTWAESLYIGQLANAAGLVRRTALGELPAVTLPRHAQTLARSLRQYEAASLLSALSA